jgi:hypothetical protein
MSRQALAGLMDLGDTSNRSRALGQSFLDLFLLSLQTIADEVADVATSGQPGMPGIVTNLVDLNWGEDEPAPKVVAIDVGTRQEVTAEALQMLISAGAIAPDPDLEAFVRQRLRLPERPADAPAPPSPKPSSPAPSPSTARPRRRGSPDRRRHKRPGLAVRPAPRRSGARHAPPPASGGS